MKTRSGYSDLGVPTGHNGTGPMIITIETILQKHFSFSLYSYMLSDLGTNPNGAKFDKHITASLLLYVDFSDMNVLILVTLKSFEKRYKKY